MRRSAWVRILAIVLVISMLAMPVSAAGLGGDSTNGGALSNLIGLIRDIIRDIIGVLIPGDPQPSEPIETTPPTEPVETTVPTEPVETEPVETEPEETQPEVTEPEVTEPVETEPEETEPEETPETVLNLVEGYTNTENGFLLRGTTYTLSTLVAQEEQSVTAPYALRTRSLSAMSLNNAVALAAETAAEETTVSDTALEITTDDLGVVIPNGRYVIYCDVDYAYAGNHGAYLTNSKTSDTPWNTTTLLGTDDKASATYFTFTRQDDGTYTIQGPAGNYLQIERNASAVESAVRYFSVEVQDNGIWLKDTSSNGGNECINALGAPSNPLTDGTNNYTGKYFGGWTSGSPLKLYAVTTGAEPEEPEEEETKVVYFPVTMFNYDSDKITAATVNKEIEEGMEGTVLQGMYFSDGSPSTYTHTTTSDEAVTVTTVTYELVTAENISSDLTSSTEFILVNKRTGKPAVDATSQINEGSVIEGAGNTTIEVSFPGTTATGEIGGASLWKYGTYKGGFLNLKTYKCITNTSGNYLTIGNESAGTTSTKTTTEISAFPTDSSCVLIQCDGYYLSDYKGGNLNYFAGYNVSSDAGNAFYIYKKGDTKTEEKNLTETTTYTYAAHNRWDKGIGGLAAGELIWNDLVKEELDADGNIQFTVPDAGIFSYDPAAINAENGYFDGVKNVYEYVGMPFIKNSNGVYTFDSDTNGVYFEDTTGDGKPDPVPGTATEFNNLHINPGTPQPLPVSQLPRGGVADKSTNGWFPYNINTNTYADLTYHFGMRADLPFSLTPNGRLNQYDSESDPIVFHFSGDDDVWIYMDGKLVVDLGGLHNRLDIEINFAANTITYSEHTTYDATNDTGSANDENWTNVVKLFNDSEGNGLINMTREEFAVDQFHTMQFFYLERGRGTSNCKVEFNLPMLDTVSVTKKITTSWSEETGEESALTALEQATINARSFDFILYKKTADSDTYEPVTNASYYLLDKDGNVLSRPATGSDGTFPLKNGQTAKFLTDIPGEGVSYYVVEKPMGEGFLTPDYNYAGIAANGFDYVKDEGTKLHVSNAALIPEHELALDAAVNKSYEITAYGGIEAIDTLEFICTNYMDKDIPNPTALAYEDIIVIDYGLPVQIDPLANDVFRGDEIEIVHFVSGDVSFDTDGDGKISEEEGKVLTSTPDTLDGRFGTFTFLPVDYSYTTNDQGEITSTVRDTFTYALSKQLTEVEVLTYLVKVKGSVIQDASQTTDVAYTYAQAKLYIVPATIMYYEENFTDLVKFTDASGEFTPELKTESQYISAYQEPGVVGTIGDSTYGSDVAYRGVEGNENYPADSHDSNGTSYFFDTTNGYVRFQYTFTGTGTSFFARTSSKTGYMQVLLFEGALENAADHSGEQRDVWYRDTYWNDTNGYADDADGTLYNIPVFTEDGLPYGTYTMLVTVAAAGTQGAGPNLERSGNEFYLDGIRIMQPLNDVYGVDSETGEEYEKPVEELLPITVKALNAYATDGESNLDVVTLRQKLITDAEEGEAIWDGENFVVLTDTNGEITLAEEYKSIGPKEEVYLAPGQKVRFSLKYWQPEGLNLYIGMKAPFGSAALNVGSTAYSLRNAADCYYDVTDNYASLVELTDEEGYPYYVVTYTFEATDKIVSLTNIKVVGNYEFTIIENTNIEVDGDGIES